MDKVYQLFGRREIFTDETEITAANVVDVLNDALLTHNFNQNEINYLYWYLRGNQPILYRDNEKEQDVRAEANNKVVVNRAFEIHSYWTDFVGGKPVQYVARDAKENLAEKLQKLNDYIFAVKMNATNKTLFSWMFLAGVGYRIVLPNERRDRDRKPFVTYALDPRYTFVVRNSGLGHLPVMGVQIVKQKDGQTIYSVYTDRYYFEIVDGKITKQGVHTLGEIPIIEYPLNDWRLGIFEVVLPMLDAINMVSSNRNDAIAKFVQALLVFKNVDFEKDDLQSAKEDGAIGLPADADVKYLVEQLHQMDTQALVDDMYQTVLTICSMPNRNNGNGGTSDNGVAVLFRDGFVTSEARAQGFETFYKDADQDALALILYICDTLTDLGLTASQVDIRFTRRNEANTSQKVDVLLKLLSNDNIHPVQAFTLCDLFPDPESAYLKGQEYKAEQERKEMEELKKFTEHDHVKTGADEEDGNNVSENGQSDRAAE